MGARPRLAAVLAVSALIGFSGPVLAQSFRSGPVETAQPAFEPQLAGGRVAFSAIPGLSNYTLRVTGPGNYTAERFSERRAPSLRLAAPCASTWMLEARRKVRQRVLALGSA